MVVQLRALAFAHPRKLSFDLLRAIELLIGLTQLNNQEYSDALEDKLQQHVE